MNVTCVAYVVGIVLAGCSSSASGQQPESPVPFDPRPVDVIGLPTETYVRTCVNYLTGRASEMTDRSGAPLPELTVRDAKQYLNGREGRAWTVPTHSAPYVVTATAEKNLCALHIPQLQESDWRNFRTVAQQLFREVGIEEISSSETAEQFGSLRRVEYRVPRGTKHIYVALFGDRGSPAGFTGSYVFGVLGDD